MTLTLPTLSLPTLATPMDRPTAASGMLAGRDFQPYSNWVSCGASITAGTVGSVLTGSSGPFIAGLTLCGVSGVEAQTPIGGELQISTSSTSEKRHPSVAARSDGTALVCWDRFASGGPAEGVHCQLLSSLGSKINAEFPIGNQIQTYPDLRQPSVTALSNGDFLVAWTQGGRDGSDGGIFGQIIKAVGQPRGDDFPINTLTRGDQSGPKTCALSNGNAVAVWASEGQDGSRREIYGQILSPQGYRIGNEFQIATYSQLDQENPALAALDSGGFVVGWMSDGQDGSSTGIYSQIFSASGVKQGGESQVHTIT